MALYRDILVAVKNTVKVMARFNGHSVVVRKRLFASQEHDSFPLVVLSPSTEEIHAQTFENIAMMDYPVLVAVFRTRESSLEDDSELLDLLDDRESLRLELWKPSLAGVSEVFDCDYLPLPNFDLTGLDHLFDISLQQFTFRASHARSE